MTFLHSETSWEIIKLQYENWKWTYQNTWIILKWHLKPVSITDTDFAITETTESLWKFTIKRKLWETINIEDSDKLLIGSEKYIVQGKKDFDWISFWTTKILLTK